MRQKILILLRNTSGITNLPLGLFPKCVFTMTLSLVSINVRAQGQCGEAFTMLHLLDLEDNHVFEIVSLFLYG